MIIIGGSSHPILAGQIAKKLGYEWVMANTTKFADQELKVHIDKDLHNLDVILLQSTNKPSNDHLMELLLLADASKKAGCRKITAVIPYFGYSRQDGSSYPNGPISAHLVARLIETSGIDKVITVDIHSQRSEGFFKIDFENLKVTTLFARELQKGHPYVVISPDCGGLPRAKMLAWTLKADLATMKKTRDSTGQCTISDITGHVQGKDCLIIDDIVDSGGTLCEAIRVLRENGAKSVSACITHGVFSGDCVRNLGQAGFSAFFVTDSIYHQHLPSFMRVVPIDDLIVTTLSRNRP